jgi:hypothetical protein
MRDIPVFHTGFQLSSGGRRRLRHIRYIVQFANRWLARLQDDENVLKTLFWVLFTSVTYIICQQRCTQSNLYQICCCRRHTAVSSLRLFTLLQTGCCFLHQPGVPGVSSAAETLNRTRSDQSYGTKDFRVCLHRQFTRYSCIFACPTVSQHLRAL